MQKKIVHKLIDECTETMKEVKLAKITPTENENSVYKKCKQFLQSVSYIHDSSFYNFYRNYYLFF